MMIARNRVALFLATCVLAWALVIGANEGSDSGHTSKEGEKKSVRLFDGKSFEGWEGNLDYWRIEDEAIVGGRLDEPIPQNEFLCTERAFGDFELRLKVKLVGDDPNAGVQFWSQRVPDSHEVSGFQADAGQAYWGALYDESRRNELLQVPEPALIERILNPKGWNDYRIRAEGDRIQIWLNGKKTLDYHEQDEGIPRKGIIGLQVHSGPPSEAWYKDIVLIPLHAEKSGGTEPQE